MKILRVQDASGKGPYWCSRNAKSQAVCDMQDKHGRSPNTHPSTQQDPGIDRYQEHDEHCGFLNRKQLYNWFTDDELSILAESGFHTVEVEGKITGIGKYQVLFKLNTHQDHR